MSSDQMDAVVYDHAITLFAVLLLILVAMAACGRGYGVDVGKGGCNSFHIWSVAKVALASMLGITLHMYY